MIIKDVVFIFFMIFGSVCFFCEYYVVVIKWISILGDMIFVVLYIVFFGDFEYEIFSLMLRSVIIE